MSGVLLGIHQLKPANDSIHASLNNVVKQVKEGSTQMQEVRCYFISFGGTRIIIVPIKRNNIKLADALYPRMIPGAPVTRHAEEMLTR